LVRTQFVHISGTLAYDFCNTIGMANTPSFFQELQDKFKQLAENSPAKDIEKNAKALAASVAGKLDLVPREELDAALRQLDAARLKLDALEARVTALEAHSSKAA
jgi:ubiquinone biosynthesis accessory factor UbiK